MQTTIKKTIADVASQALPETQVRMLPHEPSCSIIKLLVCCLLECNSIQAGLILCEFFLCDFVSTQLEGLRLFLYLRDNFWFNTIWHR
jgi:hypothetical protein